MIAANETLQVATRSRWDLVVRMTHWTVAAAVLANGLLTDEGELLHVWIGYIALAMLVLRLGWGFVGTDPARFSAFPPSLSAALAHVQDLLAGRCREHRSHNPLGTFMVYALWGTLSVVTMTGVGMAGSPFALRPAHHEASLGVQIASADSEEWAEYGEEHEHRGEGGEVLEEIHGAAANLLLVLAALHVCGVALESLLSGRNLAGEMVTGERNAERG